MTNTTLHQPTESRLRRWLRSFNAAMEAAEKSACEILADRIDDLEERVQRLEALHLPRDGR